MQARRLVEGVEKAARRALGWLEASPRLVLAAWSIFYVAATAPLAARKLLWDDEFFTLYISRAPRLDGLWAALLTGADQHPPLFYGLTRVCLHSFGQHPLALRLPALLGYWLMSVCLYAFVARRTSRLHGYAAMLFPLVTTAFYYAYEARGYGLVLGFGALALLCWQRAAAGERRGLALPGLAAALAIAVASHYYAVLLLAPLAAGELARSLQRRRWDPAVWAAFAAPAAPLALALPVIRASARWSATFWARPGWSDSFEFFDDLLRPALVAATALLVVLGARLLALASPSCSGGPTARDRATIAPGAEGPPRHELVAVLGVVALPLLGVTVAKLVTNAFHLRYVVLAVAGVAALLLFVLHGLLRERRCGAAATAAALLLAFALRWVYLVGAIRDAREGLTTAAEFLEAHGRGELPIAVADITRFHQLSYYAPPALAQRVVYLADPASSVQYLGHDTVDRGLLALQPWFGTRITDYAAFLRRHERFLLYDYVGGWSWMTYGLTRDGMRPVLLARDGMRLLFLVEPPGTRQAGAGGSTPAAGEQRAR